MARPRKQPPIPDPPTVSAVDAIKLLQERIDRGNELLRSPQPITRNDTERWNIATRNCLEKVYGAKSRNVSRVMGDNQIQSFPRDANEGWWQDFRRAGLDACISRLEGSVEFFAAEAQLQAGEPTSSQTGYSPMADRVFLVHGHDEAARDKVALFLAKLDQDIVVLHDKANQGRTIIEKLEHHGRVGFAIVLLTPDDYGRARSDPTETLQLRARQNVILELGYFLALLGRPRVCALYVDGVELPSDFDGVLYVKFEGDWELRLARELKVAGLPVDLNKVLS